MALKYRAEIDGLRAVAVLAVVFYHAEFVWRGVDYFQGGFIGVDVFFVISGYLISSIILKELAQGRFSYKNFYERRARRILPTLFAVIIASLPVAWILMLPKALKEMGQSILAALFFGANIHFFQEDSYTAEPSALKPFLHTWSLSIEEQFYVVFPILLILLWRWQRNWILPSMLGVFLVSLGLAEWSSSRFVDANFYLLHTRAWELMAGGLLAYWEQKYGRQPAGLISRLAPIVIFVVLLGSIVLMTDQMRHPSLITVLPVVATMALIWFGRPQEWVSRLLSEKIVVGVGLISYSFYLWHFPFFAFGRLYWNPLPDTTKCLLILGSLALSIASYFVIETPARNKKAWPLLRFSKALAGTFLVLFTPLVYFVASEGPPNGWEKWPKSLRPPRKSP